ncbi:hypothetical protein G6702_06770 [Polynucleobacter paneuropaeus]|nr:hypothetical protein G6702_06770 [Polynucleobacter paneuropaeus]
MSPSTPKVITLVDFEFDWEEFKGSFSLKLDSDVMKERFDFRVEIDGKYEISPPFHISPMGVPGSYPKIELTEETTYRINKLINDFFPNLKPLGLDKSTGLMIDRNTSMNDRVVDVEEVISKMKEVWVGGFQLSSIE